MLAQNSTHFVNGTDMFAGYPEGAQQASLGMGCFWGAEPVLWKLDGVYTTSVGYAGGTDTAPDYAKICTGSTGHAEIVHVVFDPDVLPYAQLLKVFFENHDPTQGERQGPDRGSQYRSVILIHDTDNILGHGDTAQDARARYNTAYRAQGSDPITTQIKPVGQYHPAEDMHQQYLAKNPAGYCSHGPTGVSCPLPPRFLKLTD